MVNPTINVNKVFRDQVEKFSKELFYQSTITGIKNLLKNGKTCVIALVTIYDNKTINPMKVLRVLSRVLYSFIENYVCIDYLGCQYKKLSTICSDKIFSGMSYNSFLGIGIPEVLMNLISCHGFMKDTSSTVVLSCCTQSVE